MMIELPSIIFDGIKNHIVLNSAEKNIKKLNSFITLPLPLKL